jgi:hypothetical protein
VRNQPSVRLTRLSRVCLLGLLVLGFALWPSGTIAQTATGTISGTVTDPQGAAMVGVDVLVHNADTGTESSFPTNSAGLYVAPYLQPGNYEVSATKSGFDTMIEKGVVLHVGQTLTVDLQLPLQSQKTAITVTAVAPLIENDKTESSQIVSENLVEGLPLVARRWENFVLLTPAVTTDGNSGLSSFRGISGLYNGNSVDGANNSLWLGAVPSCEQ